jgi:hypothetical protein
VIVTTYLSEAAPALYVQGNFDLRIASAEPNLYVNLGFVETFSPGEGTANTWNECGDKYTTCFASLEMKVLKQESLHCTLNVCSIGWQSYSTDEQAFVKIGSTPDWMGWRGCSCPFLLLIGYLFNEEPFPNRR